MRIQAAITIAVAAAAPFLLPKQDGEVPNNSVDPIAETIKATRSNSLSGDLTPAGQVGASADRFLQASASWPTPVEGNAEVLQDESPSLEFIEDGDSFAADLPEEEFDENGMPLGESPSATEGLESAEAPVLEFAETTDDAASTLEFTTPEESDTAWDTSSLPVEDDSLVQNGGGEQIDRILDRTRGVESTSESAGGIESASKMLSTVLGGDKVAEAVDSQPTIVNEEGGFWLRGARLNDVFQYLAQRGKFQYFHNSELEAPNFVVTGHLNDGDPFAQMEELGVMYGITVYRKGETVYAMNEAQMAQLPTKPYQYQLKYLRANSEDLTRLQTILQPVLTPGTGQIEFEPKTNTLVIIDNERRIDMVREILEDLDKPKEQIAIETRILRVTSTSRNRIGVDWESVLGDGLSFGAESALNTLFNLPELDTVNSVVTATENIAGVNGTTAAGTFGVTSATDVLGEITSSRSSQLDNTTQDNLTTTTGLTRSTTQTVNRNGSDLVLSPLQVNAVLRALNSGNLAQQESSPTMITEDNEQGLIQIIDRIPLILTTVTETDAGQNISEEVRYYVDENDVSDDPTQTREIGVTVTITPTILPDNTIRMKMRPRSAQVTEFVTGMSGNLFPRVNESTVDTIARVPNGYSLLVGGFYEETESEVTNKVPILGDIPVLNFAFKSTDKQKEHTSLVFIVTPKTYSPISIPESLMTTRELHERHVLPADHAFPDSERPGFNYESNLPWTLGNMGRLYPESAPSSPLHPEHPLNQMPEEDEQAYRTTADAAEAAPATAQRRRGLFNGFFKNKRNQ